MAAAFPYTYVACPCTSYPTATNTIHRHSSRQLSADDGGADTFNPHDLRANFSLYPYDHLLYCDECHQIRCPRCWSEEITNWYCPSCLFEVPSSVVKSDGNRCTRNCYNCPLCTAPLSINGLDRQSKDHLTPQDPVQPSGPYFLSCPYCDWTTLDLGVELSRPTKVTEQLLKLRNGNPAASTERTRATLSPSDAILGPSPMPNTDRIKLSASPQTPEDKFGRLNNFYKTHLSESTGGGGNPFADSNFNSQNNLARIMSLYGGLSYAALKKSREKPQPLREALNAEEGLILLPSAEEHENTIEKLRVQGHASTVGADIRNSHPFNHTVHSTDALWPIGTLLRTRKSKRCRICRHILTKPEPKVGSTRYKIRLLAQNNIPRLSLSLFSPSRPGSSSSMFGGGPPSAATVPNPAFALTASALQSSTKDSPYNSLQPSVAVQFLLTLTNPLFDAVRVTLASPATTPGAVASRVTILCPSFEIGAAGDLWDEALNSGQQAPQMLQPQQRPGSSRSTKDGEERQPEAGKIWERGRNWTSVVVEVVPGSLPETRAAGAAVAAAAGGKTTEHVKTERGVDDDVLDIPVFVRVEWEAEVGAEEAAATGAVKGAKEPRELAFWTVLGAGRIAS